MLIKNAAFLISRRPKQLCGMPKVKKPLNRKRFLISRAIALGCLGLLLIVLNLLKLSTRFSEWFTVHISQAFVATAGRISSALGNFSILEVVTLCTVLYAVKVVILWFRHLFKRRWYPLLKSVTVTLLVILAVFNYYTVCAQFAYNRAPIDLPMSETVYRDDEVVRIANYFFTDFHILAEKLPRNDSGNTVSPYTVPQLANKLREEFKRLDSNPYFFTYTPRAKSISNSWFLMYTNIAGIAFLPFGEATVNGLPAQVSSVMVAYTMAHELAHTKGVMLERDADLTACYILLTSADEYLRYCGYVSTISWMFDAVRRGNNNDASFAAHLTFPAQVIKELENINTFWNDYKGPFGWLNDFLANAAAWFNNLYLKSSGVDEGTGNYQELPSDGIDTGQTTPGTPEQPPRPIIIPVYNNTQKVYFNIYENLNR
ncbi:MAG: DUF3810 domain-containing protein [Firmicutes bacterium]|nr:DUF3810 domain-containing protein [Bacillota bacterium]